MLMQSRTPLCDSRAVKHSTQARELRDVVASLSLAIKRHGERANASGFLRRSFVAGCRMSGKRGTTDFAPVSPARLEVTCDIPSFIDVSASVLPCC